jgi:hypothetical protein
LLKLVLVFVPRVLIAAKQTITIKASITAYSTAVGPSSDLTELLPAEAGRFAGKS